MTSPHILFDSLLQFIEAMIRAQLGVDEYGRVTGVDGLAALVGTDLHGNNVDPMRHYPCLCSGCFVTFTPAARLDYESMLRIKKLLR